MRREMGSERIRGNLRFANSHNASARGIGTQAHHASAPPTSGSEVQSFFTPRQSERRKTTMMSPISPSSGRSVPRFDSPVSSESSLSSSSSSQSSAFQRVGKSMSAPRALRRTTHTPTSQLRARPCHPPQRPQTLPSIPYVLPKPKSSPEEKKSVFASLGEAGSGWITLRSLLGLFAFLMVVNRLTRFHTSQVHDLEQFFQHDFVSEQENMVSSIRQEQNEMRNKYETLLREKIQLEAELERKQSKTKGLQQAIQNENAHQDSSLNLLERTQLVFRKLALEKFGSGPYFVEFEILTKDKSGGSFPEFFTIELVPLEEMPITIYMFLEQVTRGLWDNTSFVKRETTPPHASDSGSLLSAHAPLSQRMQFMESGFAGTLWSQEQRSASSRGSYYSSCDASPYNIGFNRIRSASLPEFFIKSGHGDKEIEEASDNNHNIECFGEVVIGRDVIDRMMTAEEDRTPQQPLERTIAKVSMVEKLSEGALLLLYTNAREATAIKASRS